MVMFFTLFIFLLLFHTFLYKTLFLFLKNFILVEIVNVYSSDKIIFNIKMHGIDNVGTNLVK